MHPNVRNVTRYFAKEMGCLIMFEVLQMVNYYVFPVTGEWARFAE